MRGKGVWDDPEWQRLRKRINSRTSSRATPTVNNAAIAKDTTDAIKAVKKPDNGPESIKRLNLNLAITIPKLDYFKKRKKLVLSLAGITVVGLASLGIYRLADKPADSDITDVLGENVIDPEFDTVLPDGKKESTEENKIGYDAQRKVASFRDNIGGVPITVSQQPLPEQLKSNPDEEVKKIAEGFSAYNVISESNPKAYLGNDVKGPQTVIFHKKGLLIFILSDRQIDKDLWAEYITKLL
jgi:hypothetical protein